MSGYEHTFKDLREELKKAGAPFDRVTILKYERRSIIPRARRNISGWRRYRKEDIDRIVAIMSGTVEQYSSEEMALRKQNEAEEKRFVDDSLQPVSDPKGKGTGRRQA